MEFIANRDLIVKENSVISNEVVDFNYYQNSILPLGVIFNNFGSVFLDNIKILPNNIVFNNFGLIYLNKLEYIPNTVILNNKSYICIPKNINLSNLNYNQLIHIYNKLPESYFYLTKKDLLIYLREKKLKSILNF